MVEQADPADPFAVVATLAMNNACGSDGQRTEIAAEAFSRLIARGESASDSMESLLRLLLTTMTDAGTPAKIREFADTRYRALLSPPLRSLEEASDEAREKMQAIIEDQRRLEEEAASRPSNEELPSEPSDVAAWLEAADEEMRAGAKAAEAALARVGQMQKRAERRDEVWSELRAIQDRAARGCSTLADLRRQPIAFEELKTL